MPAKLDACVKRLIAKGYSESEAYAICHTTVMGKGKKSKRKKRK